MNNGARAAAKLPPTSEQFATAFVRVEEMMKIRAEKEFWSGIMFLVCAAVAIATARGYSLGSVGKMGPGYFPLSLGILLGTIGVVTIIKSFLVDGPPLEKLNPWPLAAIATSVVLFGLSIERLGLVISILIVTTILAVSFRGISWLGFLGLTAALIALSVTVFAYALQLPLTIWPTF